VPGATTPDPLDCALDRLHERHGEHEARRLLAAFGTPTAQQRYELLAERKFVHRMLHQRTETRTMVERLIARGRSRATAYRRISDALSQIAPPDEKQPIDHQVIGITGRHA
jgi:hypothetical protein